MKLLSIALPLLLAGAVLAVQTGALQGSPPDDLGIHEGRLKPPSSTPNSVSSQAALYPEHPQRAYAGIEPLPFKRGGAPASLQAVHTVLQDMPGVSVVQQQDGYLRAQAQTRWLRFVDDLEFWANPERGVVELRSASRLGHGDLGANRSRMERVRSAYLALPP
ncbi:MAG: DUF1499 domain-containing protein [Hydrogenophaga sp.]|nr:DUF1499 domain-containing protein [Hydrogenophaga sp.]